MTEILVRVNEAERKDMEKYAFANGIDLGEALRRALLEKMEDEEDLELLREYMERKARGEVKYYTIEEVKKNLWICDDEL